MLVGIQDDAMVLRGNPVFTFGMLRQLRTQIVRINLNWNDVAKRRPAHPQDPADPAYDWDVYDRADRFAAQNGMQLLNWEPEIQLEEGLKRMLPTFGREPVIA